MKTSRPSRIVAAIVAIFSMLFMQLAVASYACPGMSMGSPSLGAGANAVAQDMPNCEGMDPEQQTLCHLYANGEPSAQSLGKTPVPDMQPVALAIWIADLPPVENAFAPELRPYLPIALTRTTAPPIAIRNCCFRI